jgi:hypothetical protein
MKNNSLHRSITLTLSILLAFPLSQASSQQQSSPSSQPENSTAGENPAPRAPQLEARPTTGTDQSNSSSDSSQEPLSTNKPIGTATAPYEKSTGMTASRPAGAVIAPAKQRRTRTVFIRVALVAGAAAAVGTVAALSHSSPSHPH